MNTETYEAITSSEEYMRPIRQASRNYAHIATRTLEALLVTAYGKDWNRTVSGNPLTCGNCRLGVLQRIGRELAAYEKEHASDNE